MVGGEAVFSASGGLLAWGVGGEGELVGALWGWFWGWWVTHKQYRASAEDYLLHGCHRTWAGTRELVLALVRQSKGVAAWRPMRAAMAYGAADSGARVWMTPAEFTRWRSDARAVERKRGRDFSVLDSIGVALERSTLYAHGRSPVPKEVALACAHVMMGFEPPIPAGEPEAFATWFHESFGTVEALAGWLGTTRQRIDNRMRGFRVEGAQRIEITPEISLIRALDWVLRCGPYCPYGERPVVEVFPRGRAEAVEQHAGPTGQSRADGAACVDEE